MSEDKRIIEINGVKLEIDLRTAKQVDSYKVGDPVKVLKKGYGNTYDSHVGVIVGFADFQNRPAIELLIMDQSYSTADLKFVTMTQSTEDVEIAPMNDYELAFTKAEILRKFQNEVTVLEDKKRDILRKQEAFLLHFAKIWKEPEVETKEDPSGD